MDDPELRGNPMRFDPDAESADPDLPGFLARPADAPVYHGFPILEESRTPDGWRFGIISDPDCPEGRDRGDAFVVAPDNSRAGLIWYVGPPKISLSLKPGSDRWGVYCIGLTRPVRSEAELVKQLRAWLPDLRSRHARWIANQSRARDSGGPIRS